MVEENIILGLLIIVSLAIILFVLVNMRKNNAKLIELSFVNIANKILEEKTDSLSQKNLKDLNQTLEPFKEQIKDLKEQIQTQQKEQSAAKESFKLQVDQLLKATDSMNDNTENLIYKINITELLIKKNSNNSINILSNFIIEQATLANN
jgi:DNA recombination protein RmuC